MKPRLAKQLLRDVIEPLVENEETTAEDIFERLQFLAEFKYDHYEMYSTGHHFFEHLYTWLRQFEVADCKVALDLILKQLIFISRQEFELLSKILYWEIIRKAQIDLASELEHIPRYRVTKIINSDRFKLIERSSLYIGMSDGARIDYLRRQHIRGNEQVLSSYHIDTHKCDDMIKKLEDACGEKARFLLVFLVDDFSGSGSTLIRVNSKDELNGTLKQLEDKVLPIIKNDSFERISLLEKILDINCKVYLCPLLSTVKAIDHIKSHIGKLSSEYLKNLNVRPAAILNESVSITSANNPSSEKIKKLCEHYYQTRMEDEHTGNVMYGYQQCGLPLVLHHNTPNDSIYPLWNRRAIERKGELSAFTPLFMRIERHRSIKG
jgi:hypothetical protein